MYRYQLLSLFLVTLCLLGSPNNGLRLDVQAENQPINFELLLVVQSGNRIMESYAFFIKQAFAAFGIDIQIRALPYGQFIKEVQHLTPHQPFDLVVTKIDATERLPSMMGQFHSNLTTFGQSIYQLNNSDWHEFFESDTGISTQEIDYLVESIDYEPDPLQRRLLLNEFAELYMSDLLFDLPLVTLVERISSWKGYNLPNNRPFSTLEGAFASRALGAEWDERQTPTVRASHPAGLNSLQFSTIIPPNPGIFDLFQLSDQASRSQVRYLTSSLLSFDGNYVPHPEVAQQWFVEDVFLDHDGNESTPVVPVSEGKHTFILNTNFQFSATTNYREQAIAAHPVDAHDFALTLELLHNPSTLVHNKPSYTFPIHSWEVSSTIEANDTFSVYLNPDYRTGQDDVILGSLTPLPSHLLGGDLTYVTGSEGETHEFSISVSNSTRNGTIYNPQNTLQWEYYASKVGTTHTGPYELVEYPMYLEADDVIRYSARSDYPYPNEWDIQETYTDADAKLALDNLYTAINTTGWTVPNLATFAPHTGEVNENPYYWAFADSEETGSWERPLSQGITEILLRVLPDTNAQLIAFENANLDFFSPSLYGENQVESYEANDDYITQEGATDSGHIVLIFNLLNEHLRKRNIRYAFASALDKSEMSKINDAYAMPHHSPVRLIHDQYIPSEFKGAAGDSSDLFWYTPFPIPYDYPTARDLFRLEGYTIDYLRDYTTEIPTTHPAVKTLNPMLGDPHLLIPVLISVLCIPLIRRIQNGYRNTSD